MLSLFPFLAGWALWQARAKLRFPGSSFRGGAPGLCHWPRSLDDSQLSRLRQIHRPAIQFRPGIVARKQSGRAGYVVSVAASRMTIRRRPTKYKRMGEIAFMAEKAARSFCVHENAPGRHAEFHVSQICGRTGWPSRDSPVDIWARSVRCNLKAVFLLNCPVCRCSRCLGRCSSIADRHPEAVPIRHGPSDLSAGFLRDAFARCGIASRWIPS